MGQVWRDISTYDVPNVAAIRANGESPKLGGLDVVGIWRWDPTTGDATWNVEIFALLGLPASLKNGSISCWVAAVAPEDRERCLAAAEDLRRTGKPFTLAFRVRMDEGYRWLLSHGHAERDDAGRVSYVGTMADVTPLYGLIEAALAETETLADVIGAYDREPDVTQRLTRKILETLSAAVKAFFMIGEVSRL